MFKDITPEIKALYDKVNNYINIILLSDDTIQLLKNDPQFQKLVSDSIGIINYLETNYDFSESNITHYSQAYFTICNKTLNFEQDDSFYKNITDMEDFVNYLNVYIKNKISLDFDALEANLSTKKNSENNDNLVVNEQVEEVPINETTNASSTTNTSMSDEELLQKSGYTVHDVADQLINTQASLLLQRNVNTGKVFIYNSKPIIIPILKYLAFGLFCALFILLIASFAYLVSLNGKINFSYEVKDEIKTSSTIINPIPFQIILMCLIIAMICWSIIKNIKNDNVKYRMSVGWITFYTIFMIVIVLSSYESQNYMFRFEEFMKLVNDNDKEFARASLTSWQGIQYAIYAIFGILAIICVTAFVFNPKRDVERINQLLQTYSAEIRSGKIDASDLTGNNPFGGGFGSRLF